MESVAQRFLRYVSLDTQSADGAEQIPSTEKQFALANLLVKEMHAMGISDARVDAHCYVYGSIPATEQGLPALGFIAHMDTSPDASGEGVRPRIVNGYPGGDIHLNAEVAIEESMFPALAHYVGNDIIVTDGTTLLGADDKAGIAEILTLAEYLLAHPDLRHGRICIAFTPDEEVGCGADQFDVPGFGADFAYTVDGGSPGELEYENFNAASAKLVFHGVGIHPGSAKGRMRNALHLAQEFDAMLPPSARPEHTEGYEGFFHLSELSGDVVEATARYIIRDHDAAKFAAKKALMQSAAAFLCEKYGAGAVELTLKDSYYNMKEQILPHFHLIETAKAAMERVGVAPEIIPVRGGTDGARLSYMGLPCPNLGTGGHNAHGVLEFIPIQSMETVVEILKAIVELTYA
ncbi:MAG: peptidase T [Clostridia bacterium]|nr:MAG: peptidase T [Clostridia bacterium]